MPLRDHFKPPLSDHRSWEELHGAWPGIVALRLNTILPRDYYCGPRVHLGSAIEIAIAAFEHDGSAGSDIDKGAGGTAVVWAPARPTLLLETDAPIPPEYEVRVYDERLGRRLVAAVESSVRRTRTGPKAAMRLYQSATPFCGRMCALP